MKLVKQASGKTTIKMSRKEWTNMGKEAGWFDSINPFKKNQPESTVEPEQNEETIDFGHGSFTSFMGQLNSRLSETKTLGSQADRHNALMAFYRQAEQELQNWKTKNQNTPHFSDNSRTCDTFLYTVGQNITDAQGKMISEFMERHNSESLKNQFGSESDPSISIKKAIESEQGVRMDYPNTGWSPSTIKNHMKYRRAFR
jgi:hypothetical protein